MEDQSVQRDGVLDMGSQLCAMRLYRSCAARVVSVRTNCPLNVLLLLQRSVLFLRDGLANTRTLLIKCSRIFLSSSPRLRTRCVRP